MITVKRLGELISELPDETTLHAYEGEDIGIVFSLPDGSSAFIRARLNRRCDPPSDAYTEGFKESQP